MRSNYHRYPDLPSTLFPMPMYLGISISNLPTLFARMEGTLTESRLIHLVQLRLTIGSREILFGGQVPFLSGVVANLTGMISTLGENGLVGLVALGVILFLFQKRAVGQHSNPQI